MVRWAVQNEYLDANPLDGMGKPAERTAAIASFDDEIKKLWKGLPEALAKSIQCQRILRLCLVTANALDEVAGIKRAELDWTRGNGGCPEPHKKRPCPCCPVIRSCNRNHQGSLSRCGRWRAPCFLVAGVAFAPVVARTVLRGKDTSGRFGFAAWSAHDLRRTANEMARLGVAPIVLGHVANHRTTTRAGVTLSVYSHYEYDKEKRQALDLWADQLTAIVGGKTATIAPLRRKAGA